MRANYLCSPDSFNPELFLNRLPLVRTPPAVRNACALRKGAALVIGRMTAKVSVAGRGIVHVDNRYLAVWVREHGGWKFVAYQRRRSSTADIYRSLLSHDFDNHPLVPLPIKLGIKYPLPRP